MVFPTCDVVFSKALRLERDVRDWNVLNPWSTWVPEPPWDKLALFSQVPLRNVKLGELNDTVPCVSKKEILQQKVPVGVDRQ